jgi:hypothetical protein
MPACNRSMSSCLSAIASPPLVGDPLVARGLLLQPMAAASPEGARCQGRRRRCEAVWTLEQEKRPRRASRDRGALEGHGLAVALLGVFRGLTLPPGDAASAHGSFAHGVPQAAMPRRGHVRGPDWFELLRGEVARPAVS